MKSLSLSQPHLIIVVGIPGSGKTFFAEKFAETFRAPYISREKILDIIDGPRDSIDTLVYYQLHELLKTRQSILLEGGADTHAERVEFARKARSCGYETLLIWVQTDQATAKSRYQKENKPGRVSSSREYDQLVKRFAAPLTIEKHVVISGKHTYATQAKVILKKLSEPRAEIATHTPPPARTEPSSGRRNITVR
jgi:predicted kinase